MWSVHVHGSNISAGNVQCISKFIYSRGSWFLQISEQQAGEKDIWISCTIYACFKKMFSGREKGKDDENTV